MDVLDETRPLLAPDASPAPSSSSSTLTARTAPKKRTPLPKMQIAIVMLLHLSEPMSGHCIFPFINQLISELDITGGDEKKVGYYAGLVESIFFATEALFVFQWARLSDHIGRKPVLLIGLFGLTISMACFGLSKTFLGLVVSRSIVGMLNGNTGVMKSVIGELTDSTNMAQGFACIPVSWAMGATIAPMIGGQLAKPHERWPHLFSHPFWIEYPYFLPCAVAAAFCAFCFLTTAIFFKETLRRGRRSESTCTTSSTDDSRASSPENDKPPPMRTVLTRPVLISIANYGALALADIAFIAFLPLFLSTPVTLGGLGLSPPTIGTILGALGVLDGLFQALFFARAVDAWGAKRVYQAGIAAFVPLYALFPAMNAVARARGDGGGEIGGVVWALVILQLGMVCVMDMAFGVVFMYVTSSAPNSRCLGAVNGVAQFVASVMRAVGPAASTSLFASSLEYNWLGGNLGYVVLIAMSIGIFFVSTPLPSTTWTKEDEDQY